MKEREQVLKHLSHDYYQAVRDPVWKNIFLSEPLLKLIDLQPFQKLNGIKQLGPTYLVYPGATHTRLSHSLGVFQIARRMIMHLLNKADIQSCTLDGVKAFLCAALLHDLGHYPYAHSLKELEVESHESLTAARICDGVLAKPINRYLAVDPVLVAAIIDRGLDYSGGEDIDFFRNLLSGVLDPDKLDYLNRDAYFCGVPYGVQDVDFILDEIFPHQDCGLAITRKSIASVESLLFSKYLMYRAVYWHKTVRVATAMIKKAVLMGLAYGVIQPKALYWLDDSEFFSFADSYNYPPFKIISQVSERRLYKTLYRVPFSSQNPLHVRLEDLSKRLHFEEELVFEVGRIIGRKVSLEEIIIDIPERISFEIDLPVLDAANEESVPYKKSGSVFDTRVTEGFADSLRYISLNARPEADIIEALEKIGGTRILEEGPPS